MRMKSHEKLLIIWTTLLCNPQSKYQKEAKEPAMLDFQIHYPKQQCQQLKEVIWLQQFYLMEHEIQQSPRVQKISKSALQFRLLIDSLRNNLKGNRISKQQGSQKHQVQQPEQTKDQSILSVPQNKATSQSNNFLLHNQSQKQLKSKQEIQVGGRDKLKKKPAIVEQNPELQSGQSKAISKLQISAQLIQNKHGNQTKTEISFKAAVNVSTQYQIENSSLVSSVVAPRNNTKVGQIVKQSFKIQQKQTPREQTKKIKDVNEDVVIEYCKNEKQISQKSTPSQIFSFFANLIIACGIVIRSPHIKKYKNCIYFGFCIEKDLTYEGFLYFYDGKIYFGEFYNGFKHGLGVEINFNENSKMKGQFREGHKTGKFYIEKPTEKYIGYLENGLYQGEGKLTKEDCVYQGMFDRGEKNGYGQEFYPKTGVKITGNFINGVIEKVRASKSIPEIKNKSKSLLSNKQKEKNRLQTIRKKSFQKHNARMNKIRERSFRDSEYEMQFQAQQLYNQNKLHFNASRLDIYGQPSQRLPKICQEFQYARDTENNLQSIGSQQVPNRDFLPPTIRAKKPKQLREHLLETQRIVTNQHQEPLPIPCLTVLRNRR